MNGKKINWPAIKTATVVATILIGIGVWVGTIQADVMHLKEDVRVLKEDVRQLQIAVKELDTRLSRVERILVAITTHLGIYVPWFSKLVNPPVLNERGEKVAQAIQAHGIASHYVERMFAETTGRNAYDIQERVLYFAREQLLGDLKERHPDEYALVLGVADEERVAIESVIQEVVGIALRDKVLERHGKTHQELVDLTPKTIPLYPFRPLESRSAVAPSSNHREGHSEERAAEPSPGSSGKIN